MRSAQLILKRAAARAAITGYGCPHAAAKATETAGRGVDEYLSKLGKKPPLQRVDYSCRLAVKPTA